MPQQPRGEDHRRRLLADVAISHDGVARLDAGLAEQRLYARAVDQPLGVGDLGERDVDGAGDVSGLVGHRWLNAGEEHSGPCVNERMVRPLLDRGDKRRIHDQRVGRPRAQFAGRGRGNARW